MAGPPNTTIGNEGPQNPTIATVWGHMLYPTERPKIVIRKLRACPKAPRNIEMPKSSNGPAGALGE